MAKTKSVFSLFGTDKALEKNGIWIDYGDVKFLVARAGGSNIAYAELLKAKVRPYRHQIDRGIMAASEDDRITAELYAEAVIKDVQVKNDDDTWVKGIPTADGGMVPYTVAGVVSLLLELPDMFRDLRICASDANKYLKVQEEADTKNS